MDFVDSLMYLYCIRILKLNTGNVFDLVQFYFHFVVSSVAVTLCISFSVGRIQWMMKYQGMVCLAGNQVWWTWEVEDVFQKVKIGQKQSMKDYAKKQHRQIDDLVVQVIPPN